MTARHTRWLPPGKSCAVCFSVDDVHPAKSTDFYEAGGDLGDGALRHVTKLIARHPALKATLFVTANWRQISPKPTRRLLAAIPGLRDHVFLARRWPKDTMRLDRHPEFVAFLANLHNVEIGLHGLHHISPGLNIPMEFQGQDRDSCAAALREMMTVMETARLSYVKGMTPPGWNAPKPLLQAMTDAGLEFIASARDIRTPIAADALTQMSGLQGLPLIFPAWIEDGALVHIPSNFQATSPPERAMQILEQGGLLSIKAHIVKSAFGHVALDGLDEAYADYLDVLLSRLEDRFGDSIWWTSMSEIAASLHETDGI